MSGELPPLAECRPEVQAFARLMERELRKRDATRGPAGWKTGSRPLFVLVTRLQTKAHAASTFFYCWKKFVLSAEAELERTARRDALDACVDAANYAMMVVDVVERYETGSGLDAPVPPSGVRHAP